MKRIHAGECGYHAGQAMVEYVLALLGIIAVIGVLSYVVTASWRSAERTVNLVESDYP